MTEIEVHGPARAFGAVPDSDAAAALVALRRDVA